MTEQKGRRRARPGQPGAPRVRRTICFECFSRCLQPYERSRVSRVGVLHFCNTSDFQTQRAFMLTHGDARAGLLEGGPADMQQSILWDVLMRDICKRCPRARIHPFGLGVVTFWDGRETETQSQGVREAQNMDCNIPCCRDEMGHLSWSRGLPMPWAWVTSNTCRSFRAPGFRHRNVLSRRAVPCALRCRSRDWPRLHVSQELLNISHGIDGISPERAVYPLTFHDQRPSVLN